MVSAQVQTLQCAGISVLENSLKEAKKKYEKELSGTDKLDV